MAFNLNTDIPNVVRGNTGLAFVSYPDAIAKFTWMPQFFSALFFFMLAVLGVGSAVALQSAVNTVIWDQMPKVKYWKVAIVVSISGYLIGLVYVTPAGQWILELIDYFGGTFVIFALVSDVEDDWGCCVMVVKVCFKSFRSSLRLLATVGFTTLKI